jgi:hypothetical protein
MRAGSKIVLGVVGVAMLAACAQRKSNDVRSGWQMVEDRFAAAAPAVGEPAPDVTVLDADGKAHQLRTILKGNYSVLVLGCLT